MLDKMLKCGKVAAYIGEAALCVTLVADTVRKYLAERKAKKNQDNNAAFVAESEIEPDAAV